MVNSEKGQWLYARAARVTHSSSPVVSHGKLTQSLDKPDGLTYFQAHLPYIHTLGSARQEASCVRAIYHLATSQIPNL